MVGYPAVFIAAATVLLLWPMLLNGGPYYFGDTAGYANGGQVAVSFALQKAQALFHHGADGGATGQAVAETSSKVSAVRSVPYAIYAYITRFPGHSFFLGCAIQALASAFCLNAALRAFRLDARPAVFTSLAAAAIFLTPLPWFCVLVMPDIFAGLAILSISLLVAFSGGLPMRTKAVLALLIAFGVCVHLSHPPIIAAMIAVSALVLIARYGLKGWREISKPLMTVAGAAVIGLVASIAVNAVGFHKASVTGKRYPIVLASSIQQGPARWYLQKHCKVDTYAVCEIYRNHPMPDTSGEFLFGVNGVRKLATPEQMERIRKEEPEILKKAYLAYPLSTIKAGAFASVYQYFRVGLEDHHIGDSIFVDRDGQFQPDYRHEDHMIIKRALRIWFLIEIIATTLLAAWIFAIKRRDIPRPHLEFAFLTMSGCLINAVICGAMSAVTDRYQGRVIWLAMLAVSSVILAARRAPQAAEVQPLKTPEVLQPRLDMHEAVAQSAVLPNPAAPEGTDPSSRRKPAVSAGTLLQHFRRRHVPSARDRAKS